jgi:hypothetical protein
MLLIREYPTFLFIENRKFARSYPGSEDARPFARVVTLMVTKHWKSENIGSGYELRCGRREVEGGSKGSCINGNVEANAVIGQGT